MKKLSYLVGLIMLAAVAAALYFEDMAIRIAAGVIFIVGAILLYTMLARETGNETGDGETGTASGEEPARERGEAKPAARQFDGEAAPHRHGVRARGQQPDAGPLAIPTEYYREPQDAQPSSDPRLEFDALTSRILQILKEYLLAHTVALFWINRDRGQIVFGEFVSDSRNFTTARRLAVGMDLVSRVGLEGVPQILSEINPSSEQDVLVYYDTHEGVQSFIGVPVYFQDEAVAVLTADSMAPDAFGVETVAVLGKFTSLIAGILANYNQKFDLAADAKILAVQRKMQRTVHGQLDSYGVASALLHAVTDIVDWDYAAVILQNPRTRLWTVLRSRTKSSNLPYVSEGVTIDLDGSVLADVIDEMQARILPAPVAPRHRFHPKEAVGSNGQLCVAPLLLDSRCIGLVLAEYREDHQYSRRDLDAMDQLATLAAVFLDLARMRELTARHLIIDELSNAGSRTLLLRRVEEEQKRSAVSGGRAVFLLCAIDGPDELQARHGSQAFEGVVVQLASLLQGVLQPWDVLGRYDASCFGVLLLDMTAEEAYLRAEKWRKMAAGHVVVAGGVSFSTTVSIAGCAMEVGMDLDQITRLAVQALDRAHADGGNCVKVV